ncbi:MAG: glycosyltransferase family 1 protein [Chloroflexota bacterium]|nr:glycosyltransferase family 1 protein [Chloroflexota bacterium]
MRIGIDCTAAVHQRAGIGRYTRELVEALARLDRRNQYVLFVAGKPVPGSPALGLSQVLENNFRLRSVPLSDRVLAILWHRFGLPLPVEAFIGKVDIFHSPDFVLPPTRARTILTVHDLSFLRVPECFDANLRIYLEEAVPRSVRRADLVLADSESTKRDLVGLLDANPAMVKVVYPGVDERFCPIANEVVLEEVRKRYGLPQRFVLSLGTLQPRKNFPRLIEAYSLLVTHHASLKLVIVGGKGWFYDEIFAKVRELGLEGRVIFPGFIAEEDLPALYSLAELLVFPSLYEGFGLPPLEAMACGVPVVTSNTSSLPEVVGDAGLMVQPTDVEGLAEAMGRALEDRALRGRMIEKGLRRARKFTWEKSARQLLGIYNALGTSK